MKKNLTELVFILDKSGSMHGLESDTMGGFNSMLEKQKKLDDDCVITTVLFDSGYELLHDRIDIRAVSPMTEQDYSVGGCTALLDAVGATIKKIVNVQKSKSADYRAEKVIFVIITDGLENASRRFSYEQVKKMIETEKSEYGWEFIFLGANIDAAETAEKFGIGKDRAADYVADGKGTRLNFKMMSDTVSMFRKDGSVHEEFLTRIREDNEKRGTKNK